MIDEVAMAVAQLPVLETPRLTLRCPQLSDLDAWAEFAADPTVGAYLGGVLDRSAAFRQLTSVAGSWLVRGFSMFSVIERDSGQWIGRVGPWMPDGWPGTEIGWGISPAVWGRGYAQEATEACIEFAFERLDRSEVIHLINPQNHRSQALAQRVGSSLIGPSQLPPPYDEEPVVAWGQTREQWLVRSSR